MKKVIIVFLIFLMMIIGYQSQAAIELFEYSLFEDANLVAYWRLNQNANDSKASYDGTVAGADSTAACMFDYCYTFITANTDLILIDDAAALEPNYITVTAWVQMGILTEHQAIVSKWWDGSDRSWNLAWSPTKGFVFDVATASENSDHMAGTEEDGLLADTWYHVVGTYDGTTVKIFLDGVRRTDYEYDLPISSTGRQNTADVAIGAMPRDNSPTTTFIQYFDGLVDDVAIFNRALSEQEVEDYYNAGDAPATTPDPVSGSPMLDL